MLQTIVKIIGFSLLLSTTLVVGRQINQAGLDLIKGFEGWRANFYIDSAVSNI